MSQRVTLCTTYEREDEDGGVISSVELRITADVSPYIPARTYGPPEDCYDAEGGTVDLIKVEVEGPGGVWRAIKPEPATPSRAWDEQAVSDGILYAWAESWLTNNEYGAHQEVRERNAYREGERADRAYDAMRDERDERVRT